MAESFGGQTGQLSAFPAYVDERGTLVPVELSDVGFDVRRVFTVTGPPQGSTRGDHLAGCRELIVLVTGEVEIVTRTAGIEHSVVLTRPGASIQVDPHTYLRYVMRDDRTTILVLADEPYRPRV